MDDDKIISELKSEPENMEAEIFGHKFKDLSGLIEDLLTLEKEGAIYSHFWDESSQAFRYNRIKFLPNEIYQYVEAHVAKKEFDIAIENGASFEEALKKITNKQIADQVKSYGNFGQMKMKDGTIDDIRGCAASFYPPEIEALVCGQRLDRYEVLPNLQNLDRKSLVIQQIDYFPVLARFLACRKHKRPSYQIENEYDVQDLLFVCIRSIFNDAQLEDWTPKHAGSSKRIDIVIPSIELVIEVKYVRDTAHARKIADELKIDIESYHSYTKCKNLVGFVFDPLGFIVDPDIIMNELSGPRTKGSSSFNVQIFVRR